VASVFSRTLVRWRQLSTTTRTMVYLFWAYEFASMITAMFMGIFIYLQTGSVAAIVATELTVMVAIALGFVVWGAVLAQLQWSVRWSYWLGLVAFALSFVWLAQAHAELWQLLVFMALYGFGIGAFWLAVHSFEMIFTDDSNRDFYSSMLSLGERAISLLAPAAALGLFYASVHWLGWGQFELLFLLLPLPYLLGVLLVWRLPDFVPRQLNWQYLRDLVLMPRFKELRQFSFAAGAYQPFDSVIFPVVMIFVLKTVVNIGLFEIVMGLLSMLLVTLSAHHRTPHNRIAFLQWTTAATCFALLLLLGFEWSPWLFAGYTLLSSLVDPLFSVSGHTTDLFAIEKMRNDADSFYEGLLFRDLLLFFARVVVLLLLLGLSILIVEQLLFVKVAIGLWILSYVFYGVVATRVLRRHQK